MHYDNYNLHCVISIHALLAESDAPPYNLMIYQKFLSTLSLRRATGQGANNQRERQISIHALLAESDRSNQSIISQTNNFYPRSPCGERRKVRVVEPGFANISIHALLAESDSAPRFTPAASRNFYPRSPCGERLGYTVNFHAKAGFLSTLSLRRATRKSQSSGAGIGISIHALLAESDAAGRLLLS